VALGSSVPILFTGSTTDCVADTLPPWFRELDTDGDHQVSLREWRAAGKKDDEFHKHDLNGDGFITPDEARRSANKGSNLRLDRKGRARYDGAIEENGERWRGHRLSKVLTVRLEAGKTYQFDHVSKAFDAFLILEGPDGVVVAQDDDSGGNNNARIVYRAAATGTYRLFATSAGGGRHGPFSLTVRALDAHGDLKGLPPWFKELDTDKDGQVSLLEWRRAGKSEDEFRKLDLNEDGFITAGELLRGGNIGAHLKLENGLVKYSGEVTVVEERYHGKRAYKALTVRLEASKTYEIEMVSKVYWAFLHLEAPGGEMVAQHNSGGNGRTARIVHRAGKAGAYRIIATSLGGFRVGPFSLTIRALSGIGALPRGLPPWFEELDKDRDGQISIREWRAAGKSEDEFQIHDLNGDGFITAAEVLRAMPNRTELRLVKGQGRYVGAIEESDQQYRSRRQAKILTVRLEAGKTYQIDHKSKAFDAFLYLEDPEGNVVARDDDSGGNNNARIVHRAAQTGTYRVIASSAGGGGRGPFSLTVRLLDAGALPKGLPAWFKELDKDEDGQVSIQEWRAAGKKESDFLLFDLNGDGFITPDEALRLSTTRARLRLENGRVRYDGALEPTDDERFRGLKFSRIFTIKLEEGTTYQIDHRSKDFNALMGLLSPEGQIVAIDGMGGGGTDARIVYRTPKAGDYRIIATSPNGAKPGAFSLTVRALSGTAVVPKDLPAALRGLDADGDGQISLREWLKAGKSEDEFRKRDLNGDGFITPDEAHQTAQQGGHLRFEKGRVSHEGSLAVAEAQYKGKRSYRSLTVRLEAGKTYEIEMVSKVYWAFLFLEGPGGEALAQHNSGANGRPARIVHRVTSTGEYRLIATSEGGFRNGPYSLTIRALYDPDGAVTRGLPRWFQDLDKNKDGQISLREWREAGNDPEEFRKLDINGDGFITPPEALRYLKGRSRPAKEGPGRNDRHRPRKRRG
jgi:Ca2+-binding EF-hand superfamily protein